MLWPREMFSHREEQRRNPSHVSPRIVGISSSILSLASSSEPGPRFMTLSFPRLIHLAVDSQYLVPDEGDVCRGWPSHSAVLQGGHSALAAEPVCQVRRSDSFLSDLPDALNNCCFTAWHFALWAFDSGHRGYSCFYHAHRYAWSL